MKDSYRLVFLIALVFLFFLGIGLAIPAHKAMALPTTLLTTNNLIQETVMPQVFLPTVFHNGQHYTWLLLGPDELHVATMATQGSFLFAGTYDNGALRSSDSGQTWEPMINGLPGNDSVQHFAMAENVPTMYATVHDQYKIYRSEDNGNTWVPATPPSVYWVSALAMNPITPTTVYLGTAIFETYGGHVFRSQDGGTSWEQILPQYTYATHIAIDPHNTDILYLGRTWQGGMLKSYDGGDSWEPINNGLSGSALSIIEILITPGNSLDVYIATGDGLFHSSNGGNSWSKISQNMPGQFIFSMALMPNSSGTIVASSLTGDNCHGISQSVDGGLTWQDMSGNLDTTCVSQLISTTGASPALYAVAEIEYNLDQIWQLQEP